MKKFFTSVPFQKKLGKLVYTPANDAKLTYEKEHSLPILNVINNYTEKGEEIEVIFIASENDDIRRNLGEVKKSLAELVQVS